MTTSLVDRTAHAAHSLTDGAATSRVNRAATSLVDRAATPLTDGAAPSLVEGAKSFKDHGKFLRDAGSFKQQECAARRLETWELPADRIDRCNINAKIQELIASWERDSQKVQSISTMEPAEGPTMSEHVSLIREAVARNVGAATAASLTWADGKVPTIANVAALRN